MNELVKMEAVKRLEEAIKKSTDAAERLLKCAESISNPTYSVTMQGQQGELEIMAVRHFQGQIVISVKSPFSDIDIAQRKALNDQRERIAALGFGEDVIDV
jgi:hypothetical protein